ncbi:steroid 17-alpha-hydroxylase/17,20 lyase-like isoform X1 [Tubulanus polymorphus]|uniref:steroid 17-alpha-hydroxylase/17,20 lyase-like isoform X1 n=1 Tax=Tubulanus polymorphus TaxID=672921 RepID=UPI003DA68B3B
MTSDAIAAGNQSNIGIGIHLLGLVIALIFAFVLSKLLRRQSKFRQPPGPPTWPIIGNLWEIEKEDKVYLLLTKWAKQYGDVYQIKTGPKTVVILSSIAAVRDAFVKKQIDFSNRSRNVSNELQSDGYNDVLFAPYSETWKIHRKLLNQALRNFATEEHMMHHLQNSMNIANAFLAPDLGKSYDPFNFVTLIVYNFICSMIVGKVFDPDDREFNALRIRRREITDTIGNGFLADFFPMLKYFRIPRLRKAQALVDDMLKYSQSILESHKHAFSKDKIRDFTDHLLAAQLKAVEQGDENVDALSDCHLKNTIMDIFSAGTETTVNTLYWILLYVASYRDVQKRIHDEIDRVVDSVNAPSMKDRKNLPITQATVNEVMRLRPAVPLGIPRSTVCDTTVFDYDLKSGTDAIANIWALHHDPNEWNDPETFNPDRFLNEDGTLAEKPRSFLPFCTGRRVCIGETVAKPEICLVTAMVLQKYALSLPTGIKRQFEPANLGFTVYSKPYQIIFQERSELQDS